LCSLLTPSFRIRVEFFGRDPSLWKLPGVCHDYFCSTLFSWHDGVDSSRDAHHWWGRAGSEPTRVTMKYLSTGMRLLLILSINIGRWSLACLLLIRFSQSMDWWRRQKVSLISHERSGMTALEPQTEAWFERDKTLVPHRCLHKYYITCLVICFPKFAERLRSCSLIVCFQP
jgi:hypothetical protein